MTVRAILWDVMDTLVRDPFRDVMPAFFDMTLEQMLEAKHPTAWATFERGEMAEGPFLLDFFRDGRAYDTEGFKACIRSAYSWIEGMEELLGALRERGHAMHVLSNYPEWHRWIEERLEISRYVAWSFVSCRTGLRKPDPAAFQLAATTLGLAVGDCLLIDDRARNCEGARAIGMPAIHFRGDMAGLREELSRWALL